MLTEGFIEYKRREFCKDVKCPVQQELDKRNEKSKSMSKQGKNATRHAAIQPGSFTTGSWIKAI